MEENKVISVRDAAKLLGTSRQAIYDLMKRGVLKSRKNPVSGRYFIYQAEAERVAGASDAVSVLPAPVNENWGRPKKPNRFDGVPNSAGVYVIRNVKTGWEYVGASSNIFKRFKSHTSRLTCGKHLSKLMQEDWRKVGAAGFEFLVIELSADADKNARREQEIINHAVASGKCYNNYKWSGYRRMERAGKPFKVYVEKALLETGRRAVLALGYQGIDDFLAGMLKDAVTRANLK